MQLFQERVSYSYIISNDGFFKRTTKQDAESLVDNKKWFYTTKGIFEQFTKAGIWKIKPDTLIIHTPKKKSYLTGAEYDVKYIMYPSKNVNWDKLINANRIAEHKENLAKVKPRYSYRLKKYVRSSNGHIEKQSISEKELQRLSLKETFKPEKYTLRITASGKRSYEKTIIHFTN